MTTLTPLAATDRIVDPIDEKRRVRGVLVGDATSRTAYEFHIELYRPRTTTPYRVRKHLLNGDDPTFVPVGRRDLFEDALRRLRT